MSVSYQWPVSIDGVEISMADTRVLDIDEDFIMTWLLYWDLLILHWSTCLLDNLRPLLVWNLRHVECV